MIRILGSRRAITATVALFVLMGALVGVQPARTQASRASLDTHTTLSVWTCCGSIEGFNDTDFNHVWSVHNLYAKLWAKEFPGLRWNETLINDQATLETKLTLAVNAGDPPDMVFIQGDYIGFTVLRHLAQPLDQYVAQAHVSDSYFLPSMARWAHFGGHWWALPAVSGPLAGQLIYFPKYMNALGYNNSNLRTFDQLYQMSKKAVRFDKAGNLTRVGYWPGASANSPGMCPVGHGLYNLATDQPTATDPCNVAWLTYEKKLVDLYGGYKALTKFMAGDPDVWSGSPKDYMATGKALISPSANAYWVISEFDTATYGVKGGLAYQLTPLPPSLHGTAAEAASYPATQQLIVIPRGAQHSDLAFTVSKAMVWDHGDLLGPTSNGDVVADAQEQWLHQFYVGEAQRRKLNGMSGNPSAHLQGMAMQAQLAHNSKAWNAINPVALYYDEQLSTAVNNVLYGRQSPQAALGQVQRLVMAEEQRLKAQYGGWNW